MKEHIMHDLEKACEYLHKVVDEIIDPDTDESMEATKELVLALKGLKTIQHIKHTHMHMKAYHTHDVRDLPVFKVTANMPGSSVMPDNVMHPKQY